MIVFIPQFPAAERVTSLAANRVGKTSAATTHATGPQVEAKPATKRVQRKIKAFPEVGSLGLAVATG